MTVNESNTILLVDDDQDQLTVLGTCIENAGYKVILALGAKEAVRILLEHEINLIISDIEMLSPDDKQQ